MTTARSLVRGAAWNQIGLVLPALAAIALVPPLVHSLGVERFGILSLAWMLIGYFTLFDLGVSGALTRLVSERLARGRLDEIPTLVWTALAMTAGMGVFGGILVAAVAPWLVQHALHVPSALQPETLRMMRVLAACLPIVTSTAALAGVLAAQQRFGVMNAIRVPMGVLTYAAPLIVVVFARRLDAVGLALAAVRLLGGWAHLAACLRGTPGLRSQVRLRREVIRPVLSFGGWMSVTALVGPVMMYLDRFLIGALYSMAMVAYYTTPYDLTARMTILSIPLVNVLFPVFAAGFDLDRSRTARLLAWGVRGASVLLFPVALALSVFPREILQAWLGATFVAPSAPVLRWLAVGMFANGLGQVYLAFLQSSGRPDLGARLHVLELPFYLTLLWLLVHSRGIEGAAIASLARVTFDAVVLAILALRRLGPDEVAVRGACVVGGAGVVALAVGGQFPGIGLRIAFSGLALGAFGMVAWHHVARPGLRSLLAGPQRASLG